MLLGYIVVQRDYKVEQKDYKVGQYKEGGWVLVRQKIRYITVILSVLVEFEC